MVKKIFPLFSSPIHLAHAYWQHILSPGDGVIDATCGNGHDTLFIAQLLEGKGLLSAYDIQENAIKQTKKHLQHFLSPTQFAPVKLYQKSHATFYEKEAKLIVYNLGYLPGGDKSLTTQTQTTIQSIHYALKILQPNGLISITCYPGHPEGRREELALTAFVKTLSPKQWNICHHCWINRPRSPQLFLIQKAST